MAVFRSRKLGESPEKGKSRVARVFRKGKVTSWESYSHITYPHKSFRVDLKMWRFSEVRNWESYSHITYPHNSFPVDLKMWRFSEVGSWESFPKRESHQLGELLSYNLPT
ncbi:hypothetical protein [Limnospira platensis]|uniref:hypothetical protein n=1 Tax=Limnospira platensis TaxID=118562 RepID=UPI0001D0EC37|nr:hypothetical protein NIES39_L00670 [Arthrospira platensis NIES-39]